MTIDLLRLASLLSVLALGTDACLAAEPAPQPLAPSINAALRFMPAAAGLQSTSVPPSEVHPIDLTHRAWTPETSSTTQQPVRHKTTHGTRSTATARRSHTTYKRRRVNNLPLRNSALVSEPAQSYSSSPASANGSETVVPLGTEVIPATTVPKPTTEYLPPLQHVPTQVYESAPSAPSEAGSEHITGLGHEVYPAPAAPAAPAIVYSQPGATDSTPAYTLPAKRQDEAQPSPMPAVAYPQPGHEDLPATMPPQGAFNVPQATPVTVEEPARGAFMTDPPPPAAPPAGDAVDESQMMPKKRTGVRPFHAVGVQLKVGTAGAGLDLATPISKRMNLRLGGAGMQYNGPAHYNGLTASADVRLTTGSLALDIFPFNNTFRISPGVTFYNGNRARATLSVAGGQSFSLNGDTYTSEASDPVRGNATATMGWQTAPSLTLGTGNMIPRSGKHLSFPFEVGIQYVNDPHVDFSLQGSACQTQSGYTGCSSIESNTEAQTDLKDELNHINSDIRPLRFYPIVSIGVAWAFHFGDRN